MSPEPILHVVLHQPEIPQNTGNVGRSCVAVGAKLWLVRPLGFRLEEKHLRRAGMDYWEALDWEAVADWDELQRRLADRRMWFVEEGGRSRSVGRGIEAGRCGGVRRGIARTAAEPARRRTGARAVAADEARHTQPQPRQHCEYPVVRGGTADRGIGDGLTRRV